jgi:uncharacterized protein (DUF2141 family)
MAADEHINKQFARHIADDWKGNTDVLLLRPMFIRLLLTFLISGFPMLTVMSQSLSVVVTNVKSSSGYVRVAVYSNEDDFMKRHVVTGEVRAVKGQVTIVLSGLRDGRYALSIMHDSNNNGELDTNFFGIPTEGFAFSNDAMGLMGPPGFGESAFSVRGTTVHTVKLRHF